MISSHTGKMRVTGFARLNSCPLMIQRLGCLLRTSFTCGNSYSTLWHVTAWADSNTKLAGDLNYDLCSSALHCIGTATPVWNLAQSQPFTGVPPPPGFISIFGNPIQSQIITQPVGTSLAIVGVLDLTNATVIGLANLNATEIQGLHVTTVPPVDQYILRWIAADNLIEWTPDLGGGGGGGGVSLINCAAPLTGCPITSVGTLGITTATAGAVGVIQLAGDLGGTGLLPTVVNGSNITNHSVGAAALASTAVVPGAYTSANITVDQQGRITAAANGVGGGGVTGAGTNGFIPLWSGTSSLTNSPIQATSAQVQVGTGAAPLSSSTGLSVNTQPVCGSGSLPPLTTPSCVGQSITYLPKAGSSAANVDAGLFISYPGGAGLGQLGMGAYISVSDGLAAKEMRGLYVETIGNTGTRSTPRTAGWFFSQGGIAGTQALNQAIYAQTSTIGGTTTNDITAQIDSPTFLGGTMTNHVGLNIADQTVGGASNPNPIAFNVAGGKSVFGGSVTLGNLKYRKIKIWCSVFGANEASCRVASLGNGLSRSLRAGELVAGFD
jgi:hypothetical protein